MGNLARAERGLWLGCGGGGGGALRARALCAWMGIVVGIVNLPEARRRAPCEAHGGLLRAPAHVWSARNAAAGAAGAGGAAARVRPRAGCQPHARGQTSGRTRVARAAQPPMAGPPGHPQQLYISFDGPCCRRSAPLVRSLCARQAGTKSDSGPVSSLLPPRPWDPGAYGRAHEGPGRRIGGPLPAQGRAMLRITPVAPRAPPLWAAMKIGASQLPTLRRGRPHTARVVVPPSPACQVARLPPPLFAPRVAQG